jgi:exosome complex component RRP46
MLGIRAETGTIPGCTGSSRFECRGTTVFCVVHGPAENAQRQEEPENATLEVRWKDQTLVNAKAYEKYFSGVVEKVLRRFVILELDVYKTIQVSLSIAGQDRKALFCAINAAVLALVDAGIPLCSMFYSSSSFLSEEEAFVFDEEGVVYGHAFGEITEENISAARSHIDYVRESIRYGLRGVLDV